MTCLVKIYDACPGINNSRSIMQPDSAHLLEFLRAGTGSEAPIHPLARAILAYTNFDLLGHHFSSLIEHSVEPGAEPQQLIDLLDFSFGDREQHLGIAVAELWQHEEEVTAILRKPRQQWLDELLTETFAGKEEQNPSVIEALTSILARACEISGINRLNVVTTYAPQGAGKSKLATSQELLATDINRRIEAGESVSLEVRTLAAFLHNPQTDHIATGSGGIYLPRQVADDVPAHDPQRRYEVHQNLGEVTSVAREGNLVNDALTTTLVLYEMIKSVLTGHDQIQIDTYPRSQGQFNQLKQIAEQLKQSNVELNQIGLHLDLVDSAGAKILAENRELASQLSVLIGEKMLAIEAEMPSTTGIPEFRAYFLDKIFGHDIVHELNERFSYTDSLNFDAVYRTIVISIYRALQRIDGRTHEEARPDEVLGKARASVARRLSDYLRVTAPAAYAQELPIIPVAGQPPEAMQAYLLSIIEKLGLKFKDTKELASILTLAGQIHEKTVYPNGRPGAKPREV